MATIPVRPLVLKDVRLVLGTDNFEAHVSGVVFTPTTNRTTVTWKGLSPSAVHSEVSTDPSTWVCALTYAQDWDTPGSLSQYLMDNEGEDVAVVFHPRSGEGPSFTATVTIEPGAIGGTRGQVAETTVNLGVQGAPARVPAPA